MKKKRITNKKINYNKSQIDLITVTSIFIGFLSILLIASGIDSASTTEGVTGAIIFAVAYHNFSKSMLLKKGETVEEIEISESEN